MPDTAVRVENLDRWVKALEGSPAVIKDELEQAEETLLTAMTDRLAQYPPVPPKSRYQRTGDLGRGWTDSPAAYAFTSSGIDAVVRNPVAYAALVQSQEFQTAVHARHGWKTAEDIQSAFEASGQVDKALKDAADRVAKRIESEA